MQESPIPGNVHRSLAIPVSHPTNWVFYKSLQKGELPRAMFTSQLSAAVPECEMDDTYLHTEGAARRR